MIVTGIEQGQKGSPLSFKIHYFFHCGMLAYLKCLELRLNWLEVLEKKARTIEYVKNNLYF